MTSQELSHLADDTLLREFAGLMQQDRVATATLLACLGEIDARRLYAPAGYPSMFLYCVHEHQMSEDMAYKRIQAARAGRRFPALLPALAQGRLHLTAVVVLAPYLTPGTADELIASATPMTKAQIDLLLAERFPKPDLPTLIRAIATPAASEASVALPGFASDAPGSPTCTTQLVAEPVVPLAMPDSPRVMEPLSAQVGSRTNLSPSAPGRFTLQLTMDQATHDLLRYAQSLLGHAVRPGDVEAVLQRALREMVDRLEKQKFSSCVRPGQLRGSANRRHIPANVQRAVWKRDNGRCTFVSKNGKRCEESTRVEFDHVRPVARGGEATTSNVRLRCRAHNQYDAECTFGAEFMRAKPQDAQRAAARRRSQPALRTAEPEGIPA